MLEKLEGPREDGGAGTRGSSGRTESKRFGVRGMILVHWERPAGQWLAGLSLWHDPPRQRNTPMRANALRRNGLT